MRVLGLAVPTFLLLAMPFVGVVVFPIATAAGTLLARQLLGEPTVVRAASGAGPMLRRIRFGDRERPVLQAGHPPAARVTGSADGGRSHTRHGPAIRACAVRSLPSRST